MATTMSMATREASSCVIFGAACNVPERMLPTYSDVFKNYLLIRQQLKASNKKEPQFNAVAEEVTLKVEQIWSTASITSVVSHKRVLKMLQLS